MPSRRYYAGGLLRFRHPLCSGAYEAVGIVEGSDQDQGLRYHGLWLPLPGTALPRGVPEIFYALIHDGGVPSEQLEWHGHNDFHKGLINGVAAWMYGCASVNGALLGFGERTGNTPVEAMLIDYISLTGNDGGIDTAAITEMSEYFRSELNFPIPANYPFVGAEFNSTNQVSMPTA